MKVARIEDKLGGVYSKHETKEIIELVVNPLKENTERLISSQNSLTEAIHRLELKIAQHE
jgi:hypothetical protein